MLTTQDGLWRYRLGDVVEVSGFDPTDGVPVIQFVERRKFFIHPCAFTDQLVYSVAIRFPDFIVGEKELRAVMSAAAPDMLAKVVDWTVTIDDRRFPATIGFFLEVDGDQGKYGFPRICSYAHDARFPLDPASVVSNVELAPERVLNELTRSNGNIAWAFERNKFRKPTFRLVRSGTFSEFRQLKLDKGSNNLGQVKVPTVLPRATYVAWFSNRVVQELRVSS